MTDEYATIIGELFDAKVPRTWVYVLQTMNSHG